MNTTRPRPDPGGQFDSDTHRRVVAALPDPEGGPYRPHKDADQTRMVGVDDLALRLESDPHTPIGTEDMDALAQVLGELKDDGLVVEKNDTWRMSKDGQKLLIGPNADDEEEG